jgi:hypothetical protein
LHNRTSSAVEKFLALVFFNFPVEAASDGENEDDGDEFSFGLVFVSYSSFWKMM